MQNMKSVVKVVLLCSLAWCSPSLSAQHPDFQLSVSSAIKVSGVNTPISVSITLKNISAHDLSFATIVEDKQAEMNFVVKVRKQDGGSANESAYYQSLKRDRAAVSKQEVTLKPGEELVQIAIVTKLFDMKEPGRYVISAQRAKSDREGLRTLSSNDLVIELTP